MQILLIWVDKVDTKYTINRSIKKIGGQINQKLAAVEKKTAALGTLKKSVDEM